MPRRYPRDDPRAKPMPPDYVPWNKGLSYDPNPKKPKRACGTVAAARRHRRRGEKKCPACTAVESIYNNLLKTMPKEAKKDINMARFAERIYEEQYMDDEQNWGEVIGRGP